MAEVVLGIQSQITNLKSKMPTKEMIMKKLVTALALCAGISAYAAVESQNVVGYNKQTVDGYKICIPGFVKVGGGETTIDQIVDTSTLTPYVDDIQVYDPLAGVLTSWLWDGSAWTDFSTTTNITFSTGKGHFFGFDTDLVFSGQIAGTTNGAGKFTFTHTVVPGYSVFGSAFPTPLKTSNFNFAAALTPYADEVQIYDANAGALVSWVWDGTGFTDYSTYLPDEIVPTGIGVLFGNNASATPIQLIETLN
jgi:hypothetical protein